MLAFFEGLCYNKQALMSEARETNKGAFPSGQWGQTVNLLLNASVVRIHQLPPKNTGTHVPVFFLFPEDFSVCWDTAALAADPAPKDKRIKIRQSLLTNAVSWCKL